MQEGNYEPREAALFWKRLEHADVFVDVGANVGFYTCLARSMMKETLDVEPLTQNLRYLYTILQANGWTDVEVHPVAMAARPGIGALYGGGTGAPLVRK